MIGNWGLGEFFVLMAAGTGLVIFGVAVAFLATWLRQWWRHQDDGGGLGSSILSAGRSPRGTEGWSRSEEGIGSLVRGPG